MARTINRLEIRDALLSSDPETSVALPLNSQHYYSSSVVYLSNTSASLLVNTDYMFSSGERVSVVAGDLQPSVATANGEFSYPVLGSITNEKVLTGANYYGTRTNLVLNPNFESNVTNWTGASASIGRVTTDSFIGTSCARVNSTSASDVTARVAYDPNTTASTGEVFTGSCYIKNVAGNNRTVAIYLRFFHSSGSVISSSSGSVALNVGSQWTRISATGTAPANVSSCDIAIYAQSTNPSTSNAVLIDGVLLEKTSELRHYFDGSTGYARWSGTANLSTSIADPISIISFDATNTGASAGYQITASVDARVNPIYSHRWIHTNSTVSTVSSNFDTLSRYVIAIEPNNANIPVTLTLENIRLLKSDSLRRFQFNSKIYPNATANVEIKLGMSDTYASETPVITTIYGGRYGAARSNTFVMPDSEDIGSPYYADDYYYVSVEISITNHEAKTMYFTLPHLVDDQVYYENWFVNQSRLLMPDFYWDYDYQQENPIAPLHKLMEAMMVVSGQTREFYADSVPYENSEIPMLSNQVDTQYNSILVDPLYAKNDYLPWLSQFTGTKIKRNIFNANGERLLPNTETENEYARWQLNTGYYGINAGTREAILESVRQALVFTKDGSQPTGAVAVTTKYAGDIFSIRIQTLLNETMDVTTAGGTSAYVLDAVEPARPLGYKVIHTTAASFALTLGDETLGVVGYIGIG